MTAPRPRHGSIPRWIVVPLALAIIVVVDRIKNPDKHAALMRRMEQQQAAMARRSRWVDSVALAQAPASQAAFASRLRAFCDSLRRDSTWRTRARPSDAYGPSGRLEGWVGRAVPHYDRGVTFELVGLSLHMTHDTLSDSLLRIARRLYGLPARFSATFQERILDPCNLWIAVRVERLESLPVAVPAWVSNDSAR